MVERAGLGPGPPGPVRQDLRPAARPIKANDDYLAGKVADFKERKEHDRELTPEELIQKQLDTNFRIMEQIRARVDAIVEDPKTAAALKPYYPYGCKRPTFHDEYLPTFNRPNVTLVDTAPMGVQEINERGVVHDGVEYPLDVLIYATGFQWMATSTFNMIVGRGGRTLSEKWQTEGTKTFLGAAQPRASRTCSSSPGRRAAAAASTSPTPSTAHADYVVWMLQTMRDRGERRSSTSRRRPRSEYAEHCRAADIATAPLRDCLSLLQRPRRGRAGQPRLLRRRPVAQVARQRPRSRWSRTCLVVPERTRRSRLPSDRSRCRPTAHARTDDAGSTARRIALRRT